MVTIPSMTSMKTKDTACKSRKEKTKKQCRKMETAIVENNNNRRTEQTGNQQKERKADRKQTETITQQHTTGNSKERE